MMVRILIVEDESVVVRDIREMLEAMQYEVAGIANSKETAIQLTRSTKPDLILMDIKLQGSGDGIDAVNTISEITDIPVIFITAYSDHDLIERAVQVMPYGYLLKPFQENELRFSIENTLLKFGFEKKLKVSVERYQRLFEQSNDPIILHTIPGEIIDVNERACELLGYTKTELLSMKILKLHPCSEQKSVRQAMKETGKTGFIRFETRFLCKNGEETDVEISSRMIDAEQNLVQAIARDITERKSNEAKIREMNRRLEERVRERTEQIENANLSLRKLSLAVEYGPAVVLITNAEVIIEYVNSRFTAVLGYNPAEVTGKDARMFNASEQYGLESEDLLRIVRTGKIWRGDVCSRHKKGDLVWLHALISPIIDENKAITHFVAVAEDITEKKRIEAELKSYMAELEMFNKSMVDREMRVIELKEEINAILKQKGEKPKYPPIWNKENA